MPEYLAPGVYVEEVAFRGKSIEGVSTSSTAFTEAPKTPPDPDGEWKYVALRRYLFFLEHSIDRGTQWAVFEPDGQRLWAKLADAIASFLELQYQRGFLVGGTRDEAYFVRRARPDGDSDDGYVIIEVGVAPEHPGYFEVFRLRRATADAFPPAAALPELPFALTADDGALIGVFARATGLRSAKEDDTRSPATFVLKEGRTDFAALKGWVRALRGDEGNVIVTEGGRRRWRLARGRIVRWKGPNLSARGNEVAIEELELAHEGITIQDDDGR